MKGYVNSGIDDFKISTREVNRLNDPVGPWDKTSYRGRAVGLNFSGFTQSQASFRMQFDSFCFTTQLECRSTGSGRLCKQAR